MIYAPDVDLPLPPAYQRVHTMSVPEAVSIAAAAEAARRSLALPDAARGGAPVISAPMHQTVWLLRWVELIVPRSAGQTVCQTVWYK